jgi:L-seryl-tRNA(Ser) seleniumtransferase
MAQAIAPRYTASVVALLGQIGSGSLPIDRLPSHGLALAPVDRKGAGRALDALSAALRGLPLSVIGRIADDQLLLDLRCLEDPGPFVAQLPALAQALR